jgi:hypothetical protein
MKLALPSVGKDGAQALSGRKKLKGFAPKWCYIISIKPSLTK